MNSDILVAQKVQEEGEEQQGVVSPSVEEQITDANEFGPLLGDEVGAMRTNMPNDDTKKENGKKGKSTGRGKKATDESKESPAKKRKRSNDREVDKENQVNNENKKENGSEDGDGGAENGSGARRKKGPGSEAWTDEADRFLVDTIKKHTNNNIEAAIPWKKPYKDFQDAFPDSQRTLISLKRRWFQYLKHGEVELTEEQVSYRI